jgi:hypothetical protein
MLLGGSTNLSATVFPLARKVTNGSWGANMHTENDTVSSTAICLELLYTELAYFESMLTQKMTDAAHIADCVSDLRAQVGANLEQLGRGPILDISDQSLLSPDCQWRALKTAVQTYRRFTSDRAEYHEHNFQLQGPGLLSDRAESE